jgi:hypothetical protein
VYNGNVKEKPALCEQQSLLAANEEKEWVMSERCIKAMMFLREKRVLPFPNLPRQDNDGENKATELCCIATHEQSFIRIVNSVPEPFGSFQL